MIIRTRDPKTLKIKEIEFFDFASFYAYIIWATKTKACGKLSSFNSFNWKSPLIIDKFRKAYEETQRIGLKDLRDLLYVRSDKNLTQQFWLDRGWSEEEASERIYKIQRASNQKFVEKFRKDPSIRLTVTQIKYWEKKGYIHEEAVEKRREHQLKGLQGTKTYVSKSSMKLFQPFVEEFARFNPRCGSRRDEMCLYDPERSKHYYYDLTFEELKLIFEFNGSHVHPHPDMSPEKRSAWRQYFSKKTASEVEIDDALKNEFARSKGYKLIVLWEKSKFKKNSEILRSEILLRMKELNKI